MARKVFISYRRDDAKAEARSLYQHFQGIYGRDGLFMDVDSIEKGQDFTKVLGKTLAETAVMLVVMGRTWLHQQDESGRRRLDDAADYVRLEIAHALRRNIPVIPIRVDGARLPRIEELPDDIKELSLRQGTSISHENFDSDVRGLEADLARLIVPASAASPKRIAIAAATIAALVTVGGTYWALRLSQPATQAQYRSTGDAATDRETEVRRRVELVMADEARRQLAAQRAEAEAAAIRQAELDAARQNELLRIEAEAKALRQARAAQEKEREAAIAKAEAAKAAAAERSRARTAEIATAWDAALSTKTLDAYLAYLRANRDASNLDEARRLAKPLLISAVEDKIDEIIGKMRRPDGSLSYFTVHADLPRAAAMCIDWRNSSWLNLRYLARGASGQPKVSEIDERVRQALAFCQSVRPPGANCVCEIVRRNDQRVTPIPDDWIARQLD